MQDAAYIVLVSIPSVPCNTTDHNQIGLDINHDKHVKITITMSVEDINTIDFISPDESTVVLTIADNLEWGSQEHLYNLNSPYDKG